LLRDGKDRSGGEMPNDTKRNEKILEPDQIVLVGKTTGRELTLKKTVNAKGVVFYEAPLDWRNSSSPNK
jgi:hypothetical protein